MLNGMILGQPTGHALLQGDPYAGQPNYSVGASATLQAQVSPLVSGVSQEHNYNLNTDPSTGTFYHVPSANHTQITEAVFLGEVIKQGFLFVTITHSQGVVQRMSNESLDGGTHYWAQSVKRLPSLSYESKANGGYITVTWGKLAFFDGVFTDANGVSIANPSLIQVKLEWGWRDDRTKLIFEGQGALRQISESGAEYDLFEPEFKALALTQGIGFSRCLSVTQLTADGTSLVVTTGTAHGYNLGDSVLFQPVNDQADPAWAGTYILTGVNSTTQFVVNSTLTGTYTPGSLECSDEIVPLPLVLGTPSHPKLVRTGTPTEYRFYRPDYTGVLSAGLTLYDDGVDISATGWAMDQGTNQFLDRTNTQVFGQLTATGTGNLTNLQELFVWGAAKLGVGFNSLDVAAATAVPLDHVVTSQGALIDLLDQVAGYSGFAFYIQSGVLTLYDRSQTHGNAGVMNDLDLKEVSYSLPLPAKSWASRWNLRQPGQQRASFTTSGGLPIIQDLPKEVVLLGTNVLGEEKHVKPWAETETRVRQRLQVIKGFQESTEAMLTAPLERFPSLGELITYPDQYLSPPATFTGRVWSLELNFDQDLLTIKAKGGLV